MNRQITAVHPWNTKAMMLRYTRNCASRLCVGFLKSAYTFGSNARASDREVRSGFRE